MSQDTGKFRTNTHDKYYTKATVAVACVNRILGLWPNTMTHTWIEPSAGAGAFLGAAAAVGVSTIGLDIDPEADGVIKTDFLKWVPGGGAPYLLFGNPPFGRQGSLAKAFIRHGTTFCDRVAFILPRSFLKPSMNRVFPSKFHCCYSEELTGAAFEVNGIPYSVPCVFQMWIRQDVDRPVVEEAEAMGFAYVKPTETHHLVIRRVGVRAGTATVAGPLVAAQSHYFVRLEEPARAAEIATKISAHVFPSNTTGPRSLSKGEINAVLTPLLASYS